MKYLIIFFSGLILICSPVNSQVGINTLNPDQSAALEVKSPTSGYKGILVPRLNTLQRTSIPSPADGLLVYDTDNKLFYFFDGSSGAWNAIGAWKTSGTVSSPDSVYLSPVCTNVGIGTTTPTEKLEVNGNLKINGTVKSASVSNTGNLTTGSLSVGGFPVNSLVPSGAIIMWSGATVPPGWTLCDGTNGTPDLRGRFIAGYDPSGQVTPATAPADGTTKNYGSIGNKGGETGHLLTSQESGVKPHGHNITDPGHSHSVLSFIRSGDGYGNGNDNGAGALEGHSAGSGTMTNTTGISIDQSIPQNASLVHENRPPYYVLAFIMKLP